MDQLSMQLRDDGIARAVDHADAAVPKWADRAYFFFHTFASTQPSHERFMTEDVREYARASGLPEPPDKRAWGGIAVRARKAGLIVPAGYMRARDPKVHCSVNPAWKRA